MPDIYVLGGAQTDFARNWAREGKGIYDLFAEVLVAAVEESGIEPERIESGHVGNFVGDLFARQGLLNGYFGHVYPELSNIPTGSRVGLLPGAKGGRCTVLSSSLIPGVLGGGSCS